MSFLNKLKDKLNEIPVMVFIDDNIQKERIAICNSCPDLNPKIRQCKICWCFVDAKTTLKDAECPAKKW
jgi:hypothetical protein